MGDIGCRKQHLLWTGVSHLVYFAVYTSTRGCLTHPLVFISMYFWKHGVSQPLKLFPVMDIQLP